MKEFRDLECTKECSNEPADSNPSLSWDAVFRPENKNLNIVMQSALSEESFQDQMDRLVDDYRQGGMSKSPEHLMDKSKELVDKANNEFIDTWHKLKPQFDKIEPAVGAANSAIERTLKTAAQIVESMGEPDKSKAQKNLQMYQDLKEFPPQSRANVLSEMSSIKGLNDTATTLSHIEDDYVLAIAQMSQISTELVGPLLRLNFAAQISSKIHNSYYGQDVHRNKDIEFIGERNQLIKSTIGTPASTLLSADAPYLKNRYNPDSLPVQLFKTR